MYHMYQLEVVKVILKWIEENIRGRLSLNDVTYRVGYSKWHFQRMFKETTGRVLGQYLRERRLSHAALELRLTSKPIIDIALGHGFDSVQTFTRAFKHQFEITPAVYRKSPIWSHYGICTPIRMDSVNMPPMNILTWPELQLVGKYNKYACCINNINEPRHPYWVMTPTY